MTISFNDGSRRAAETKLNNSDSGFTLIELVVGITVMLFVMLSLVVFVSVGTRGYSTSNAEVSLQMESQIALNQIEDMVMEGASVSGPLELNGCTVYSVLNDDGRMLLILDGDRVNAVKDAYGRARAREHLYVVLADDKTCRRAELDNVKRTRNSVRNSDVERGKNVVGA